MVRLKDIAERAAVSIMTVSKALRDAADVSASTKARIRVLAQQMGYVPDSTAQGLRTRNTRLLGLVAPSVTDPLVSRSLLAIQTRAAELGYDVLLACTLNQPEREEGCIRRFLARRVAGLFIVPAHRIASQATIYQELLASRLPTVIVGQTAAYCSQFTNVEGEDLLGASAVTQHLLRLGHRRIAFLAGPLGDPAAQQRFEGYRRALRAAGLDVDDGLVFQAGVSIDEGVQATLQLINERPVVTAIQGVDDLAAIGCAAILQQQGLNIPGDVSVAGYGNIALSQHLGVPLTTVHQPKYRLGLAAVESMVQLLKGSQPGPSRIPADLIVRASTGIPPATPPFKRQKLAP